MSQADLIEQIHRLRRERNAIILAHSYQRGEIQDIADFVGDSLALARQAQAADCDVIVFCGVHFMAETACILNPSRTVLLILTFFPRQHIALMKSAFPEAPLPWLLGSALSCSWATGNGWN